MKVNILFQIKDTPHGGGNQFLKSLKKQFKKMNVYTDVFSKADVFLFNSHQHIEDVLKVKDAFPNSIFIHRVDGPMRLYNTMNDERDSFVYRINQIANGTVFQSDWSKRKNFEMGLKKNKNCVIYNAVDASLFYEKRNFNNEKIRLISTSWSNNLKKGFATYQYLDEYLDFDRYEYWFIGNSPVQFKNIKMFDPLPSKELGEKLRQCDIFVTASQNDPCSNSVIEALATRLPVVALSSGGHPEIVGQGGRLFKNEIEAVGNIEIVRTAYTYFRDRINIKNIEQIANQYIGFFEEFLK